MTPIRIGGLRCGNAGRRFCSTRTRQWVWAVIDEAASHRPNGGVRVHRERMPHLIRNLIELANLPSGTIQLLRYVAGEHAPGSPFSILRNL
ncbi:Scr1 family TA system antitoxin-like transcriptional regulator [Nocardia sp. R6R-6]|uniref:Scr1 family TA system antitoxin-like transcriptional regulator n=1 Tax=Nocardia sp. R6R-6 TaxID=3459303 RepID=UPI00403D68BA